MMAVGVAQKAIESPVQQVKSGWEAIEGEPAMSRTVKSLGKTYCVVVFTNSTSTYEVPKKVTSIDCLVVGGGGSGGGLRGGGGGAGGINYQTGLAVAPGETLKVTVGDGAAPGSKDTHGYDGKPTTLELNGQKITAQGGGYGGRESANPSAGASGGGAAGNNSASYSEMMGGASTAVAPEQGHAGGDRLTTAKQKCGAGGGGAGGKGGDVNNGKGGDGLPSAITGDTVWYAAGGAGGGTSEACEGAANTGNGGGGGFTGAGYAGGSGVVIIRYALPSKGMVMLIY